jgi:ABC-type phosphate/phosphonate transport system substrate-binding protein
MKLRLSKPIFSIFIIFVIFFSTTLSFANEDKIQNKALGYIEKLEELILEIVPEGQKEQVEKLFDELRDFLEKELDLDKESGSVKETMWLRKVVPFTT